MEALMFHRSTLDCVWGVGRHFNPFMSQIFSVGNFRPVECSTCHISNTMGPSSWKLRRLWMLLSEDSLHSRSHPCISQTRRYLRTSMCSLPSEKQPQNFCCEISRFFENSLGVQKRNTPGMKNLRYKYEPYTRVYISLNTIKFSIPPRSSASTVPGSITVVHLATGSVCKCLSVPGFVCLPVRMNRIHVSIYQ